MTVPIKTWTEGVPYEDGARQQVERLAELPVVGPHVAIMPDVHAGIGCVVGSVVPTRKAIIPAAVGVDIGCFSGETRIPLLDGMQETLENLSLRTESFWVYSVDAETGCVAPGKAVCVKTRTDAELMRVVVSGGDEIFCTPDHEFMLFDGSYRTAEDLRFNDSLMPLYRRWATRDGYEGASSGSGYGSLTHIAVWEALHGEVPDGYVVHHINHVHFDNRPDNLMLMTRSEHSSHHRKNGRKFNNADPEFQKLRQAGIDRRVADPVKFAKMSSVGTENITRFMRERPEEFASAVAGNGKRGAPHLATFNRTPRKCGDCDHVAINPAALTWHQRKEHGLVDGRSVAGHNHKVVLIDRTNRRADVFCLQVEKHHNFALAAGVFVHNCGMVAARTSLTASRLPDNLHELFVAIAQAVPHGSAKGQPGVGSNEKPPVQWAHFTTGYEEIVKKHPKIIAPQAGSQLGTLGGGNHFIEICLDNGKVLGTHTDGKAVIDEPHVWVMLHSGSRGVGNKIGTYFTEKAREAAARLDRTLPDKDLAWLDEGTEDFDDYWRALMWAQKYAKANRGIMLTNTLNVLMRSLGHFTIDPPIVECHHNYAMKETHFGEELYITRKGAVSARAGELGIIPGSMGAKSFIVRGKGNAESFHSCSHGAGRVMSRGAAKKNITLEQHAEDTRGVECRKDAGVLDESPRAYKPVEAVIAAQSDLIEVVTELKAVLCVKG